MGLGRPNSRVEGALGSRSAGGRRGTDVAPGAPQWGQKLAPLVWFLRSIRCRGGLFAWALAFEPNRHSRGHLYGHGCGRMKKLAPAFWGNGRPCAALSLQWGGVAFGPYGASGVQCFGTQRPG